jgi:predicted RNA-binding Zn-ribbon protein involved in translation (DUF1610 family)
MPTLETTPSGPVTSSGFPAHDPVQSHLSSLRLKQLESVFAESDAACPSCRGNLRGNKGGVCPECGRRLILVGTRHRALLAASAGWGLGVLLNLLILAKKVVVLRADELTAHEWIGVLGGGTLFVLAGLGLLVLLRYEREFQTNSSTVKGWVIAAGWGATLASLAVYLIFK